MPFLGTLSRPAAFELVFLALAVLACARPAQAGENASPTVRLLMPADCELVVPDGNFRTPVEAVAEDLDGELVAVRFYSQFGSLCGIDSIPPYTSNCPLIIVIEDSRIDFALTAGAPEAPCGCSTTSYQGPTPVWAVAVDDEGATTSSDTIQVFPTFPAHATPGALLALPDADFESASLVDGAQATGPGTIGAWTFAGTAGAALGVLNPTAASYPAAAGNGTPAGADGANIAFVSVPGGSADSAHVFRVLPDTLRRYSRYWLQVAVGWPLDAPPEAVSPFEGAVFELRAGTTVIAQGTCSTVWKEGEFFDLTTSAVTDHLPPELIGQALSIHVRLMSGDSPRAIHFDRVRLIRQNYRPPGVGVPDLIVPAGLQARAVPNPSFGTASIEFTLEGTETVTLAVYDPAGRLVTTRTSPGLAAGPQRMALPADLAPGLYFARLEAGLRSETVRFVRLGGLD